MRIASFLALTSSLRLSVALSGSYWISPCLSLALYGSLWLPLWLSLPLSGILWPSLAHYCSLISRIQSLIGSQGPCSALSATATLTHFLPLWRCVDNGCRPPTLNWEKPWHSRPPPSPLLTAKVMKNDHFLYPFLQLAKYKWGRPTICSFLLRRKMHNIHHVPELE